MSYVSVRTSTIRPGTELMFDVFVLYKDTYLKYKPANSSFESDVLDKFKKKKVKKLFIPADQEPNYLKYLDVALDGLKSKNESIESRADFAQDTLKQESENISQNLETEEAYKDSENRILKVVEFMLSEPKALANMLASAGLAVDDSSHSATLSSLCLAVGAHSKFVDKDCLTDMAVAALLHDSELKELGFNASTEFNKLEKDDKAKFRKHPQQAIDKVAGKKFITTRVLRLIEDHEERGDGKGFPKKKNLAKLNVDSQIFNLCDAFDHYTIRTGKSSKEALDPFIGECGDDFEMQILQILESQVRG